jgi:hypothetical protein
VTRRLRPVALLLVAACAGGDAPGRGARADAPPPPPAGWVRDTVLGLSLALPGPVQLRTVELPEALEERLEEMQSYRAAGDSLRVTITRAVYRPGQAMDLRSSAEGSIAAMQAMPGVAGLQYQHTQAQVSGVPAVRTAWSALAGGEYLMRGEFVSILRERTLWQVQTSGPAGVRTETEAGAVLASVRVVD